MKKKLLAIAGTAAMALTAFTGVGFATTPAAHAAEAPAVDVPADYMFAQDVEWSKKNGFLRGYDDGTFRPTENITREATAALFYRAAGEPEFEDTTCFNDLEGTEFAKEVCWFKDLGITTGYDDGGFHPRENVSREAYVTFLMRMDSFSKIVRHIALDENPRDYNNYFTDIADDNPFRANISDAWAARITNGWDDGTFRPHAPIQRVAAVAMAHRYFDLGGTIGKDAPKITVSYRSLNR